MISRLTDLDLPSLQRFNDVIDVRSPAEFAIDHLPGAINLPVLNDQQRAEIGTIYVQESRSLARRLGAAHVARNIAQHLESALADRPSDYRPLIYCWRGGQRSMAMALVLDQVGWRPSVLDNGYRRWRQLVTAHLYEDGEPLRLVLLDGNTGCAKTDILHHVAAMGLQTLDLEGLAAHRGSVFGQLPGQAQPSQKLFESRLLIALSALDRHRLILIEAESNKVGDCMIPPALWRAMQAAPRVLLQAPIAARVQYLVSRYSDIAADPDRLVQTLQRLRALHGGSRIGVWTGWARAGALEALAKGLIEDHYDPAYRRSCRRDERPCLGTLTAKDLDDSSLRTTASELCQIIAGIDLG